MNILQKGFAVLGFDITKNNPNIVKVDRDVFESFVTENTGYNSQGFEDYRTYLDPYEVLSDGETLIPAYPIHPRMIYALADYNDAFKTIIQNLNREIFRNGYSIEPIVEKPDETQKQTAIKFLKNVNDNQQDIIKVSRSGNRDAEIIDEIFLLMTKDYYWDDEGHLIGNVPVELIRSDPRTMRLVADRKGRPGYNEAGEVVKFCLIHRGSIQTGRDSCPNCGRELQIAHYRHDGYFGQGEYTYFSGDEMFHTSKYNPSLSYGFPQMLAVWMKITTLMNQDKYIMDYYAKQRPPRGLLFVNTSNVSSLKKAWGVMLEMFKQNPHMIPPIAVENDKGTKGKFVEFIDFMRTLDEMQFIEMRQEYRQVIGGLFGVMPIFQGDLSQGGGLNNEGLEITITNRAMEFGQGIWNNEVYPWIMKQLGITDYKLELNPSEEKDEAADIDLKIKKATLAQSMQAIGYDVTYTDEGEFEFDPVDEPIIAPEPGTLGFPSLGAGSKPKDTSGSFGGSPQKTKRHILKSKKRRSDDVYEVD